VLVELRVSHLGVIEDQTVALGPGLIAVTGETGAGKTLLVDAISLLVGAPADPSLVAPGEDEARVEGRFVLDPAQAGDLAPGGADELVLARAIPASGRSRAYRDGRMVPASQLAEIGGRLVDLHGQHAHQSLLSPAAQRSIFDRAAGVDTEAVAAARRRARQLARQLDALGGDPQERARRLDLLRYQLAEIERAGIDDPDEDERLADEEEVLADAAGLADAARVAWEGLSGDGGVADRLGTVLAVTNHRRPLGDLHQRLLALQGELADLAGEARRVAETTEADPERLAAIGERRRLLGELRRKYGPALSDVRAYRERLETEIDELAGHDRRHAAVAGEHREAQAALTAALVAAHDQRRSTAPTLATAIEAELRTLALPRSRFVIEIGENPVEESVTWMFSANPGQPPAPLGRVASGGELARVMLAARLVLGPAGGDDGPPTLVFDEVDAGIGGESAYAVGRALAALGSRYQVLVVTHLAQVAAFADQHLHVSKMVVEVGGRETTVAAAAEVGGPQRVVELARMLSGRPGSDSARRHAEELLRTARELSPASPEATPRPG
jgi:DNA repair protein RecN (Recombination protein N)